VKLLLDTHALLWFAADDRRLGRRAQRAMESADAELYISAATVWEMAIKCSVGRLALPSHVDRYVGDKLNEGYRMLPVEWSHAAAVEQMPWHHRDPFDRLLAAQALVEEMPVVTRDRVFRKYGLETVW
jgi:PIN domain nuclease of toxin-antitoxin system